MIVLWNNKLYEAENMPYRLFQSLKEAGSHLKVKILELTESSYKEEKEVPINDLEDWSVVRNLAALGRA